jgi:hypothetical protein
MVEWLVGKDAVSAIHMARETGVRQQSLSRWLQEASTLQDEGLEFPILPARELPPDDMGGFPVSPLLRQLGKLGAEALIDQELHFAFLRRGRRRSDTMTAPFGSSVPARGRPRGG